VKSFYERLELSWFAFQCLMRAAWETSSLEYLTFFFLLKSQIGPMK
jgi:hypothetical protein